MKTKRGEMSLYSEGAVTTTKKRKEKEPAASFERNEEDWAWPLEEKGGGGGVAGCGPFVKMQGDGQSKR